MAGVLNVWVCMLLIVSLRLAGLIVVLCSFVLVPSLIINECPAHMGPPKYSTSSW